MLYKRGQIWWYEFSHNGRRYQKSTGQRNKQEARKVANAAHAAITLEGKAPGKSKRFTFRDAMTAWWEAVGQHHKSWETTAHQLVVVERVFPMDIELREITTGVISKAMAQRAGETTHNGRPPADATLNREIYSNLRRILSWFKVQENLKDLNEIDWRQLKRKELPRVREFSSDEIQRILSWLEPKFHQMWAFYATYGVRMMEAYISPDQFDLDGQRVTIRDRKDDSTLTVPILEEDIKWLAPLVTRSRELGLTSIWFSWRPYLKEWKVIPPSTFQTAMKRAYRKAGISNARAVHDWRHHAATQFVRGTKNLKAAQRLLGHSSIEMTARYAHAAEDDVRQGLRSSVPTKSPTIDKLSTEEDDMK